MENTSTRHDTLLIIIAVLLGLLVLGGTALGFYLLGNRAPASTNSSNSTTAAKSTVGTATTGSSTVADSSTTTGGAVTGTSASSVQSILDGLKSSSGSFDASKVDSTLSGLLGNSNTSVATTLSLVPESQVQKNNQSGSAAVKTYLDSVTGIINANQTSAISQDAMSQIFNGDTSALTAEAQKNQTILTKLAPVGTPNEAIAIQREYLTLFGTSVTVINGESTMLSSGSVDYAVIGQAQGLVNLSKQIDADVAALKKSNGL